MDTLNQYRQLVRNELEQYAGFSSNQAVRDEVVFDTERDRYLLVSIGWEGDRRILQPVLHVDIINGKIWVQEDNTDWPIAEAFVKAGVPKEDIVLGFHPEYVRKHTGFAVS
ncbi:element excision factor XisI family protein [Spirosoma litoris]